MDLSSSILNFVHSVPWDDVIVWAITALAGLFGLIALVNALDLFFDAEAG